jgi:nucleoside-diphosphate-sugar epimerase
MHIFLTGATGVIGRRVVPLLLAGGHRVTVSTVPNTVLQTVLHLRLRRLAPFAIAHALLDGASVLTGVLLPALRA